MSEQRREELLAELRRKAAARAPRSRNPEASLADSVEPGLLDVALGEIAGLNEAVQRRTIIGQATGILMERNDLTAEAAFEVISRLSQEQNIKLYDLCRVIVERRR